MVITGDIIIHFYGFVKGFSKSLYCVPLGERGRKIYDIVQEDCISAEDSGVDFNCGRGWKKKSPVLMRTGDFTGILGLYTEGLDFRVFVHKFDYVVERNFLFEPDGKNHVQGIIAAGGNAGVDDGNPEFLLFFF